TNYILNAVLNGCPGIPDTLKILVDSNPHPVADAGPDVTMCINKPVVLTGSGGMNYNWSPTLGTSNPDSVSTEVNPAGNTTYTLIVTNIYCTSTDTVTVTVDRCLTDITSPIPNAISPNGDGSNDVFIIPDIDYFKDNSLTIYNRWGNVIYTKKPYLNEWDGKSNNGSDLPDATYYYLLDLGNKQKPHVGFVIINR
ncbi:MAG: T9SS type B sorting domain-containing protein, partial [Bacteroidia bacterium]